MLVNSPNGEQKIETVSESGYYFDKTLVAWDERTDGQMPEITLGKMRRQGNELITLPDFLPAHLAAINEATVPIFVTRRQARLALLDANLLSTINDFIATQPEEQQIFWNDSAEIYRAHRLVLSVGAELNLTTEQLDNLFILAATK